jgi:peptide subunit release factor 1 (eRF1)
MMGNKRKGYRHLYQCEECGVRRMVSWRERNRAAIPRCNGCGSARMELVSEDAKEDLARLNRERVTGPGGSVGAATENVYRRKVR